MISNLRTLDFQQIHSFIAILRHGGITAAADQLGIAKSAVSKQLSQLEQVLGVKLLERTSRRLQLTREGEHILPQLESLLAEAERLLTQAYEEQSRPEGKLRIAASPEFGAYMARAFFPQITQAYPGLTLTMEPTYSFADLQDTAFDIAFRLGSVQDDRLVARPLGSFRRILVASPGYLATRPLQQPGDLAQHNCLIFSGQNTHTSWTLQNAQGETIQLEVAGNIAIKSFTSLMSLAEAGMGVAKVPAFIAQDAIAAGRLYHCLPDYTSEPMPVLLTYRFGADKIQRIKAVLELALAHIPALLTPLESPTRITPSP